MWNKNYLTSQLRNKKGPIPRQCPNYMPLVFLRGIETSPRNEFTA